jgi:hypothetical protein
MRKALPVEPDERDMGPSEGQVQDWEEHNAHADQEALDFGMVPRIRWQDRTRGMAATDGYVGDVRLFTIRSVTGRRWLKTDLPMPAGMPNRVPREDVDDLKRVAEQWLEVWLARTGLG